MADHVFEPGVLLLFDPQAQGVRQRCLIVLIHRGQRGLSDVGFCYAGGRSIDVLRGNVSADLLGGEFPVEFTHGEHVEQEQHLRMVGVANLGKSRSQLPK